MPRFRNALRAALATLLVLVPAAVSPATGPVSVLYDAEFGGYVPVLGGIERPDLAVDEGLGRVPETARKALRRAKSRARHDRLPEARTAASVVPGPGDAARKVSRRWLRKTAITTEFLVLDPAGQPVSGARVYRYLDPSYYVVNQDTSGARLYDAWRFMPFPFPGPVASATVSALEPYWRELGFAPVAELTANIDAEHNPWARPGAAPAPVLEFVGRTNESGMLRTVSGAFNLRDARRFPHAVVPDAMRLGFVIVADGFLPGTTERRFASGGSFENRTVQLLLAPDHALFTSGEWLTALRAIDVLSPIDGRPVEHFEPEIARLVETLEPALAGVAETDRPAAQLEAQARLWERLGRRLSYTHQLGVARRVVDLTPQAATRLYRLALLLAHDAGVDPGDPAPRTPIVPAAQLEEAEALLRRAVAATPRFAPAYRLLDELLVRRGAEPDARRVLVNRLLHESPFDPWARARMAVLLFRNGRDAEAFDHLRFTYMTLPGLGGDRELALALSAYYWRLGLPEKAGAYAWLLTGRPPEDPFAKPRAAAP